MQPPFEFDGILLLLHGIDGIPNSDDEILRGIGILRGIPFV